MRVQTRLLKWHDGFTVQHLYDMMLERAQEKMRAIRKKLITDMKAIGLVRMTTTDRV